MNIKVNGRILNRTESKKFMEKNFFPSSNTTRTITIHNNHKKSTELLQEITNCWQSCCKGWEFYSDIYDTMKEALAHLEGIE